MVPKRPEPEPERRRARGWLLVTASLAAALAVTAAALAQRGFFFGQPGPEPPINNIPYDGRFTFARLKFTNGPGGYYYRGLPAWAHGYPTAEHNLMQIMNEVSYLAPHIEETNALAFDDPELCKYPVTYMTEGGFLTLTDTEAAAFRAYLQKGGFVIFDDFRDDFRGSTWENFESGMKRVLPEAQIADLEVSHPIFHSFFEIDSLDIPQDDDRESRCSAASSRTTIPRSG